MGLARSMGTVGLARSVSMILGLGANIAVTRIILHNSGVDGFSTVATVSTLSLLIPFADLGVGAALVNETVDHLHRDDAARYALAVRAALNVALLSALTLVGCGAVIGGVVGWSRVLGSGVSGLHHPNLTMFLVVLTIAIGVPLGLGARVLQGTGQILSVMVIQGVIPLLTLLWMITASALSAPLDIYCLGAPVAVTLSGVVLAARAIRRVRLPLRLLITSRPPAALVRRVVSGGLSFTIITVALAVAFQTDRVVLSHYSSGMQLAIYGLIAPVFAAAMSLISMSGQLLWPYYRARLQQAGVAPGLLLRHVALLGGAAGVLGITCTLALPVYARVATDGVITVPLEVRLALLLLLAVQAMHIPSAYVLTDGPGFRFGACLAVPMAILSVVLSIVLAPRLGASGVLLGSALAVLTVQLVPTFLRARRFLRTHRSMTRTDDYDRQEGRDDELLADTIKQ